MQPQTDHTSIDTAAPAVEFRVVAAATPAFLNRVRLLAASIRMHAGAWANGRIVVTLSRDVEPYDVAATAPWSRELGIDWDWVDAATWDRHQFYGSAFQRLTRPTDAAHIVLLDADTLVTGELSELATLAGNGLAGVIAHVSPALAGVPFVPSGERPDGATYWQRYFEAVDLPLPALDHVHTGWGEMDIDPARRACPGYLNHGVLVARATTMAQLGTIAFEELERVSAVLDTFFRCQLAIMSAAYRLTVPIVELPMAWNFPNDERFLALHPADADDVRVLHYLRSTTAFDRDVDTASLGALDRFLATAPTSPVDAALHHVLAELRPQLGSDGEGARHAA